MCGIAAIALKQSSPELGGWVRAMTAAQRHRGPDFEDTLVAGNGRVALGHTRLSIVDLSPRGHQPLANEDESLWLVFNGEIYNHAELRRGLEQKGHRFRSATDCEVILHLYEDQGPDLLARLRGMFAFALYDERSGVLFCARDRLGKKPLVYATTPKGLALASEIPALAPFPGIDSAIDATALGLYLLRNLRHVPDPWTLYKGVRRLPPGHAMEVRDGRVSRLWRYWRPEFTPRPTTVEEVRAAFDEAVALRRLADVEVAALLSGGVDSSAVVEAMVSQGSGPVRTYALGRDEGDEELVRARRAARHIGTRHREFYFDPERQHRHLETLLGLHGEPVMLLPLLYAHELCRRVRDDGIKVVMAGHGADEVFYGYGSHNDLALLTPLLSLAPAGLRPFAARLARAFPPASRAREALLVAGAAPGRRKGALYRDEGRRLWAELLDLDERERRLEGALDEWLGVWLGDAPPPAYIDEASLLGLMHENAHSVTIAGDLPAMAAGVEVRCPFLDHELVELGWRVPWRDKVPSWRNGRRNKWILKLALAERLPQDLLYAEKRGFGYSISEEEVLRGPWKARVDDAFATFDDVGGILDRAAVRRLKAAFDRRQGVPAMLIAKLYALQCSRRLTPWTSDAPSGRDPALSQASR
ncbi:MAG: asparagine synthase (glutamine-hydrolyzing) [Alphaproteobacteria bacterium]|nr:asparagine synthase (glutamine-hydrolyzing) [Alphaproteobacteria bacterium]